MTQEPKKEEYILGIQECEEIIDHWFECMSKIIPNYLERGLTSRYGLFGDLIATLLQLEIAFGMEDGRYNDRIPVLFAVLKKKMNEFLSLFKQD